jgi:hypothetical protein
LSVSTEGVVKALKARVVFFINESLLDVIVFILVLIQCFVKKIKRNYRRLRRRGRLFERANYFLFCLGAAQTKQKIIRTLIPSFFGGEAAVLY